MGARMVVLVDLEATLDRHWFGGELVLRGPIPALEPAIGRHDRSLATKWRADRWTEPERVIDLNALAALRPYHRDGALALMTERPPELRTITLRRLAAVGLDEVPLHHVGLGEHPAYGKRRIARAVRPALTIEDDLQIAEFLARFGYETLLVDERYNRGPIRSINLMRVGRADLARVLALRLFPDLEPPPELEPALEGAPVPA
jgi:hypothetical protein